VYYEGAFGRFTDLAIKKNRGWAAASMNGLGFGADEQTELNFFGGHNDFGESCANRRVVGDTTMKHNYFA